MKRKIVGIIVAILMLSVAVVPVAGTLNEGKNRIMEKTIEDDWIAVEKLESHEDEAIVGFYGPLPYFYQDIANVIANRYSLEIIDTNDNLCSVLYSNVDNNTFSLLQKDEDVKYVQRNQIGEFAVTTPNDPHWNSQWGPQRIDAQNAWDITTGSSDVVVAVIDTGIDYNHNDISGNYILGGYDWVNDDNDPMDDNNHGTHCAGIIGAVGDNSIGIAGMNWEISLLAEKVINSWGSGTQWDFAKGTVHAVNNGADIMSISLRWINDPDSYLEQAIQFGYNQNRLIAVAAGNDYGTIYYPAKFPEAIAVGATDLNDNKAAFSNYGPDLDIVAPGVDIYSTIRNNNFDYFSGTSMACPHVAGVAALMKAINPDLTSEEIRCILEATAEDLGDSGWDQEFGHGLVDAYEAVSAAEFRYSIDVVPNSQTIAVPGSVDFTVNVNLIQGTAQPIDLSLDSYYPLSPYTGSFNPSSGTPPFTSTLTIEASSPQLPKILRVVGSANIAGCNIIRHSNYFTVSTDPMPSDDLVWIKTSLQDDGTVNPRLGDVWTSPWIWSDPDPPHIGETNKLYVRVGNLDSGTDSGPVLVKPYFNEYPFTVPIKDFPSLETKTIDNIPAGGYVDVCWDNWFIPEGWPEHFCVFAQAWRPGFEDFDDTFDIYGNNNIAQKNFVGVYPNTPYTTTFTFENPTAKPMKITIYMKPPNTEWAVDLCIPSYDRNGTVITPLILPPGQEKDLQLTIIPEEREPEGEVDVWYTIEGFEEIYDDFFRLTFDVLQDTKPPSIEITRPKNALYILDREIMPLPFPLIIGGITVTADAYDNESGMDRVECYIDDELMATDEEAPFEMTWNEVAFCKHTIKVMAYDTAGNVATDERDVWIFNWD